MRAGVVRAAARLAGMVWAGVPLRGGVGDAARGVVRGVRALREAEVCNARVGAKWALLCASSQWREVVLHDLGGERAMRRWERRRARVDAKAGALREAVAEALRDALREGLRLGGVTLDRGRAGDVAVVLSVAGHSGLSRAVSALWPALPSGIVRSPSHPDRLRVRWGRRRSLCGTYALARLPGGADVLRMVWAEARAAGVELAGLSEPAERRRHRKAVLARMAEVRATHADPEVAARRSELRAMRESDDAARAEWCGRHGRADAHTLPPMEVTPDELRHGASLYLDMDRVARKMRRLTARTRRRARRRGRVVRWRPTRARSAYERFAVTDDIRPRGRWPPFLLLAGVDAGGGGFRRTAPCGLPASGAV